MPHLGARSRRTLVGALGILVISLTGATSPAQAKTKTVSLKPAERTDSKFGFNVSRITAANIAGAEAKLRSRETKHTMKRPLSADRVRAAAGTSRLVWVRRPPRVAKGRLEVSVTKVEADGASATGESEATPTSSGPCAVDPDALTAAGCELIKQDTAASADPWPLWGQIGCANDGRHQRPVSDGDQHVTAMGTAQGDSAYRRMTVQDGDDAWGERCELGINSHENGDGIGDYSTFQLYEEGERKITFISERYPSGAFNPLDPNWKTVLQMKQAQPSAAGGGGPMIEVQIRNGKLHLIRDWKTEWTTQAPQSDTWTRYALDVTYSQDPNVGRINLYVDTNGDGDANDPGEQSPTISAPTLRVETEGGSPTDGIAPGESIPSHLRAGIYQNPLIPCPTGCVTDLDNVQVVAPS